MDNNIAGRKNEMSNDEHDFEHDSDDAGNHFIISYFILFYFYFSQFDASNADRRIFLYPYPSLGGSLSTL